MDNVKKVIIAIVGVIILCVAVYGIRYLTDLKKYKETIRGIIVENVDLSKIKDGDYIGSFDATFIEAKVNVKVKNHEIVDIKLLEHKNERGKRAEVIPQKVVQAQLLKVDAISGATNSSKVILKSIENALKSGENN